MLLAPCFCAFNCLVYIFFPSSILLLYDSDLNIITNQCPSATNYSIMGFWGFGAFEPDLSRVDKLNLEAARFNFDMTRLRDVVEAARFKAETDDDFIVQKLRNLCFSSSQRCKHLRSCKQCLLPNS